MKGNLTMTFAAINILFSSMAALCGEGSPASKKPGAGTQDPLTQKSPAAAAVKQPGPQDTLVVIARLTEIPGKFPPNDLYNYVYIMKYRVVKVLKGAYAKQEILVGHYNPLIPRQRIKDKMAPVSCGNVAGFDTGAKHALTLISPIERVWKDAVEDDYADSDLDKYYAIKADVAP